jgi:tryptophan synthase alpha chain
LAGEKRKALVAFITAGDPDLAATQRLFAVIEKNGADIIELGVPFSDPLADGPVIQKASQRSLKAGTTLKKIIALVAEIRKQSQLPIVLMSSYNPVFVYGHERFVEDAVRAGVDGIIIPDMPPEEAGPLATPARSRGLDMIFLLAPTSTPARMERVEELSRGFIYYVSITGTTGTRVRLAEGVAAKVREIKKAVSLPVMIGFGISNAEQAAEAAAIGDGVVLGSSIVKLVESCADAGERDRQVGAFVAGIRKALDGVPSGVHGR